MNSPAKIDVLGIRYLRSGLAELRAYVLSSLFVLAARAGDLLGGF